jgi:hypothetical protein
MIGRRRIANGRNWMLPIEGYVIPSSDLTLRNEMPTRADRNHEWFPSKPEWWFGIMGAWLKVQMFEQGWRHPDWLEPMDPPPVETHERHGEPKDK